MHVTYLYTCGSGHSFTVSDGDGDDVACPVCQQVCGWSSARYRHTACEEIRGRAYTSEDVGVDEQAAGALRLASNLRGKAAQALSKAEEWTDKDKRGYNERKAAAMSRQSSSLKGKDMRAVGEVTPQLYAKRIQESGDPSYWLKDTRNKLAREGLLWGKR